MINAVPADTPETKPVEAPTVAILNGLLDQVPPVDASANWVVEPTHNVNVPVIAAGVAGNGFIVIVRVALIAGMLFVVNFKRTILSLTAGV